MLGEFYFINLIRHEQLTYPTSDLAPQFGCGAWCIAVPDLIWPFVQVQVGVQLPVPEPAGPQRETVFCFQFAAWPREVVY
jgi:hypothetical protein